MAQYVPATTNWTAATLQAQVGNLYHLGLSDGTNLYGYMLLPDPATGWREKSDVAKKDALVNYGSPNLVDRDLAYFPRESQGDFSGGGFQIVQSDVTKFWDSDLDFRVPGYLALRPRWARFTQSSISAGSTYQVVAWNNDFWYSFAESNGHVYSGNGGATTTPSAAAVVGLATEGQYLYAGQGAGLWRSANGSTWTQVASALNGIAAKWWVFNQGTNGYFAYYLVGTNNLYKMDLTLASPIAAGSQVAVPLGSNAFQVVDLVAYQTGLAILTNDISGNGFDVWYFDGQNLTRIIRVDGYLGEGICEALGSLYVGCQSVSKTVPPILAMVGSGSFQIVAKPGSPFPTAATQTCLGPIASTQTVYWPILTPSLNGISAGVGYIVTFDVLTGAVGHLPNLDALDFTTNGGTLRAAAAMGESVACIFTQTTTGFLQYQVSAFGTLTYQSSGWIAGSNLDFATPAIEKRFRTVEVHHTPLKAGEQIVVEGFIDLDPLSFTTALAPSATVTNSTLNSNTTTLTFPSTGSTVGHMFYWAVQLTAGTSNLTTPRVQYIVVEVGGTWTWDLNLACTSKVQMLNGSVDDQGILGKDRAYMLRNAYENGTLLTLYHRNGTSYVATIESCEFYSPSPMISTAGQAPVDEEYHAHVVLRQVA